MSIRIQLSRSTVKDLHSRLQHAYQRDDVRLVRQTFLAKHRSPCCSTCSCTTCRLLGLFGCYCEESGLELKQAA